MAKHPPAFQYYPADFEGATRHWTPAEVGCYQRLLNHQWINGPLPKLRLWRIAGATSKEWPEIWETLAEKFQEQGGGLVNVRMEAVRAEQEAYRNRRAAAGRLGGIAKAEASNAKAMPEQGHGNVTKKASIALALQSSSSSSSLPTPSTSKEHPPKTDSAPHSFEQFWDAYGHKHGRQAAIKAWRKTAKTRPENGDLLAAVERYHQSENWRKNVRLHASTWLNGARWEDEIDDSPASAEDTLKVYRRLQREGTL